MQRIKRIGGGEMSEKAACDICIHNLVSKDLTTGCLDYPENYPNRASICLGFESIAELGVSPLEPESALRGEKLFKDASNTINGERQTMYGEPEDSFFVIGSLWGEYLRTRYDVELQIKPDDVAFMMVQYKMAREMNQHKRDNLVDIVGYAGILDDMES
jgi:hypothetical protein